MMTSKEPETNEGEKMIKSHQNARENIIII
jgi:hypothetical protein